MMTAYYFSSQHTAGPLLYTYKTIVCTVIPGCTVVSTWHEHPWHNPAAEQAFSPDALNKDPEQGWEHAKRDLRDLSRADTLVAIDTGPGGKGGRHVEFGAALMWGHDLHLIGDRPNVFYCAPDIRHYDTFDQWLLAQARPQWSRAFAAAQIAAPDGATPTLDTITGDGSQHDHVLTFSLPAGVSRETVRRLLPQLRTNTGMNIELGMSANPSRLILHCPTTKKENN